MGIFHQTRFDNRTVLGIGQRWTFGSWNLDWFKGRTIHVATKSVKSMGFPAEFPFIYGSDFGAVEFCANDRECCMWNTWLGLGTNSLHVCSKRSCKQVQVRERNPGGPSTRECGFLYTILYYQCNICSQDFHHLESRCLRPHLYHSHLLHRLHLEELLPSLPPEQEECHVNGSGKQTRHVKKSAPLLTT